MATIHVERSIAAPPDEVFAWLADSSNFTRAPLVLHERRTKDGQGAAYGVGAVRELTALGAWFREEITVYDPPHEMGYRILKSLPPMRHEGGLVRVTAAPGGSHVTWDSTYTMRVSVLEPLVSPLLKRGFADTLAACERALVASR